MLSIGFKINESDFNDAIVKIDKLIQNLCDAYKNIAIKNQVLTIAWTGRGGDTFFKWGIFTNNEIKNISSLSNFKI